MPLDTRANVKARLGITSSADDPLLDLLRDAADRFIAEYCGRDFGGGTFVEYFSGRLGSLLLRNFPILTVTGVKVDPARLFDASTVLPTNAYIVHSERGVIEATAGTFLPVWARFGLVNELPAEPRDQPRTVQVTYTTATDQVPASVLQAYALLIGHWYRETKTKQANDFRNVQRSRVGEVTTTYQPMTLDDRIPQAVLALLQLTRMPNL